SYWLRVRASTDDRSASRPHERMHEGILALARRGGKAWQADQGRQRSPCASGRSLQADREFRPCRDEDDPIRRKSCREVRDSTADIGPTKERPQEHRKHEDKSLRRRRAGASTRTWRPEPERGAWFFGGDSRGNA